MKFYESKAFREQKKLFFVFQLIVNEEKRPNLQQNSRVTVMRSLLNSLKKYVNKFSVRNVLIFTENFIDDFSLLAD